MKAEKTYTVKTRKIFCRTQREDQVFTYTGTIPELTKTFGYTLEVGKSWNQKINQYPKTIKSLVSNVQKSYEEQEACCYDRTYIEQVK